MTKEQIEWEDDSLPVSPRFDDQYFNRHNGLEETRQVFIEGNDLPNRWDTPNAGDKKTFNIGELGFGTGLNYLATLESWRKHKKPGQFLRFYSFEAFPLSMSDCKKALSPWPEMSCLSAYLPDLFSAQSRVVTQEFPDGELTVFLGDVTQTIEQLNCEIASWYLDGFSPQKNPEMWSETLLRQVGEKTSKMGTFSTFTSAGHVRRSLEKAGFEVERVNGYGRKRHRLQGIKL